MAFDAVTLQHLEDVLGEAFAYHNALDTFLLRCGLSPQQLHAARERAEARNAGSRFPKASKRLVSQVVLEELSAAGDVGDRIVAAIITNVTQMAFPGATDNAKAAVDHLREKIKNDRDRKADLKAEQDRLMAEKQRSEERVKQNARAATLAARDGLRDRFFGLMQEANAQTRGYLFEAFLNDLFSFEGLDPRKSFKLLGEQIDGTFSWAGRTFLAEAKWTKDPAAGAEFGAFNYKIEGKTADTRGIFLSVNGYSPQAIEGMNGKGALKFICLDGTHLARALSDEAGLPGLLKRLWRHADETGQAYLPASKL